MPTMRIPLIEERSRPNGNVTRRVVSVGDLSWLGKAFTGQGRAVTLTKVEASGDTVTWWRAVDPDDVDDCHDDEQED